MLALRALSLAISPQMSNEWTADFEATSKRLPLGNLAKAHSSESFVLGVQTNHARPTELPAHGMPNLDSSKVSLKALDMV